MFNTKLLLLTLFQYFVLILYIYLFYHQIPVQVITDKTLWVYTIFNWYLHVHYLVFSSYTVCVIYIVLSICPMYGQTVHTLLKCNYKN